MPKPENKKGSRSYLIYYIIEIKNDDFFNIIEIKKLAFEAEKKEIKLRNANNSLLFKVIYRLCDGFYL